jgi:hypothetical protein
MTKEQVEIEFKAKLKALLREYDAEISASDHWLGYAECGEDVRITCMVGGIYKDGVVVREYTEIDFGNYIDGKEH